MRSISILLVFVAVFFSLAGKAQQQATRRVCDTIHYEFVHEKIIIPVTVNGVKVKYIVDTGGQTGTVREDAVEMKATRGIGARGGYLT